MVTSDVLPEVEIWPVRACAMHPAIIMGTVRSLWTWQWCRYQVPQNVFLFLKCNYYFYYLRNRGLVFYDVYYAVIY